MDTTRTLAIRSGGSRFAADPHGTALDYLQVFYYPQAVTVAMGPTELCPGTAYRDHGGAPTAQPLLSEGPAGTVFITDYPILHRRATSSVPCKRDLLKYMYWRTAPPARDWAGTHDTRFDFHRADWDSPHATGWLAEEPVSRRFHWLCAEPYPERLLGAQAFPLSRPNSVDGPWGYPGAPPPAAAVQPGYTPPARL